VGSYETSVLAAARRFDDLGIAESPLPTPAPLEAVVRALHPVEARPGDAHPADPDPAELTYEEESRDGTRG
jgi:DNA recombination protein RmuC